MIDDRLPCYQDTRELVYAKAHQNQLLVPLVEKALAKLRGGYSYLHGDESTVAFRTLTGFPCYEIIFPQPETEKDSETKKGMEKEIEDIWTKLRRANYYKYLMCAITPKNDDLVNYNLPDNHAYSVLKVTHDKNDKKTRLIQLRNPTGYLFCLSKSKHRNN